MEKIFLSLIIGISLAACNKTDDGYVFTLYSNVPSKPTFREHIATFDNSPGKNWGEDHKKQFTEWAQEDNLKNCEKTATFFQVEWDSSMSSMKDPAIKQVKYWCEKGKYRE